MSHIGPAASECAPEHGIVLALNVAFYRRHLPSAVGTDLSPQMLRDGPSEREAVISFEIQLLERSANAAAFDD